MTTETVLTNQQCLAIGAFGQSPLKRLDHARAIEQAVLQSPEVRRLVEALRWAVDSPDDSAYWIHQARGALAAMEKQP